MVKLKVCNKCADEKERERDRETESEQDGECLRARTGRDRRIWQQVVAGELVVVLKAVGWEQT